MKKIIPTNFFRKSIQVFLVCLAVWGGGFLEDNKVEADCSISGFYPDMVNVIIPVLPASISPFAGTDHGHYFKFDKDIVLVFTEAVEFLLRMAGGLAFFILILGGIYYMVSGSNPDEQNKAKKIITYVTVGLAVILVSYSVVNQTSEIATDGTGAVVLDCYWQCDNWSACAGGNQTRTCVESCGATAGSPVISRACVALPDSFDWRDKDSSNWMTSVKNQETCGSCWAFATTGYMEAIYNIEQSDADLNKDFSEQDLVSCSDGSCSGGNPGQAVWYVKNNGIVEESCFAYSASDEACSNKCVGGQLWNINSWFVTADINRQSIKTELVNNGPVVVSMNMSTYNFASKSCVFSTTDHAVVIVGYDDNDSEGVWIVKNSFGIGWESDGGYFKVKYGECGIDSGESYAVEGVVKVP